MLQYHWNLIQLVDRKISPPDGQCQLARVLATTDAFAAPTGTTAPGKLIAVTSGQLQPSRAVL